MSLNGVEWVRPASQYMVPFARHYYTRDWTGAADFDSWFSCRCPWERCREPTRSFSGPNREPSWQIMVAAESEFAKGSLTRLHHPDRSAKSRDGGNSGVPTGSAGRTKWTENTASGSAWTAMCPKGSISPAIDLGEKPDDVKKLVKIDECRIGWDVDVPDGCGVRSSRDRPGPCARIPGMVRIRRGGSPCPGRGSPPAATCSSRSS